MPDLEFAFRTEVKLDFYRGGMFLARAYAAFLARQNRKEEASECLNRLEETKRAAPRFVQRTERAWFNKGKALRKQLSRTS